MMHMKIFKKILKPNQNIQYRQCLLLSGNSIQIILYLFEIFMLQHNIFQQKHGCLNVGIKKQEQCFCASFYLFIAKFK